MPNFIAARLTLATLVICACIALAPSVSAQSAPCAVSDQLKFGASEITDTDAELSLTGSAWICFRGFSISAPRITVDRRTRLLRAGIEYRLQWPNGTVEQADLGEVLIELRADMIAALEQSKPGSKK
jgi:hypothetical protein